MEEILKEFESKYKDPINIDYIKEFNNNFGREVLIPSEFVVPKSITKIEFIEKKE